METKRNVVRFGGPALVKVLHHRLARLTHNERVFPSAAALLLGICLSLLTVGAASAQNSSPAPTPNKKGTPAPEAKPTPSKSKGTPAPKSAPASTPVVKPTPTPATSANAKSASSPKPSPAAVSKPTPDTPRKKVARAPDKPNKKAIAAEQAAAAAKPPPTEAASSAATAAAPGAAVNGGAATVASAAPMSAPAASVGVPSASSGAAPELPAIPGYAPGEALPTSPGGANDVPQMQLIPEGMTPLQPVPLFPGQNLGNAVPLVQEADKPPDLKALKYKISRFTIKYGPVNKPPHPGLPPAQELANKPVLLGESKDAGGGLVGPGAGARDVPVLLGQVKVAETFSGDALQAIYGAIVADLNKRGIVGVFVVPDPEQINPATAKDLRNGTTDLTLIVYASEVKQVRTIVKPVAKWPFKTASTSIDDPKYWRLTLNSPLKGPINGKPGSLLQRAPLQDYVDRVNRYPGRRVDLAVTASGEQAGIILDYIVHTEVPQVFGFLQVSNTGTEASGTWRGRAGIEARQLAGLDDILDASFETSLSSSTYSAFGSYQITPIFPDKFKLKLYGGYGKFNAEDVGFDQARFVGKSATIGLLGIYTPYYFKGFPIDVFLGVEYKYVDIADVGLNNQEGSTTFLLPYLGVSTDKATELYTAFGSLQVQPNVSSLGGTDNDEIQKMGRFAVDKDFVIAKFNLGGSFFLEPILFRKSWKAFADEADDAKRASYWHKVTEAHELYFLAHGQYTFGDKRLIPQFEDVIGGFASVRGYPEAYTSGDDSFIFNAEYRFHLPRVFKPADIGKGDKPAAANAAATRFSLRPPTILGRPDLDVVLRAFYDFGYVKNNNLQTSTELNRTLMSVGVGAEVQVSRYLNLRLDVGFPLISVSEAEKTSRPVDAGSSRVSFVGVLTY